MWTNKPNVRPRSQKPRVSDPGGETGGNRDQHRIGGDWRRVHATLFVGATKRLRHGPYGGHVAQPGARVMTVIGMASVLAAVIVMVLEMTNQFQLTLPVMLTCGVAYAISTQFGAKPLYGNPIEWHRREGFAFDISTGF